MVISEHENYTNIYRCRDGSCLWERLRTLQRAEVDRALDRLVGRYEIDALFERRDKLVAHSQGLIDEYGEGAVLFDPAR
jgi:hypothetical protein